MTVMAIPGLDPAPTTHPPLLAWVRRVAELTTPDRVVWCDGSEREWRSLTDTLVETGTFTRLRNKPNSFWCATDPDDAGPADEHSFICSRDEADAGPTNTWMDPVDAKIMLTEHYRDCMTGRTMYVVPFCMGPLTGEPILGVQITDSPYVVVSMHLTTRTGSDALALFSPDNESGTGFVRCLHSLGAPLKPGQADAPWPTDHVKYVSYFPDDRMIWTYGSGHVDTTSVSLRLASVIARDEGWLAEHMAILKLTSPENKVHYLAAAFPAACGKTTLAMLEPNLPEWTIELVGDDVAWLRFGTDGRLYASNPETAIHGLAPGTGWQTNPNAMRTLHRGNTIYTNTGRTNDSPDDVDVWWEGYSQAPPDHLTTWQHKDWTLARDWARGTPTTHPDARYTTPISQCPITAPEWTNPRGVPISAILLGSRRSSTVPLVAESRDWQHGVFLGATLLTETTSGGASEVRRDPMAMHTHLGYHIGDYLQHWLDIGTHNSANTLPKIFSVNWFRLDDTGRLLWPGFGENARVLKWIAERLDGHDTAAVETPIGWVPTLTALHLDGLDIPPEDVQAALTVDLDEWRAELPLIEKWFTTIIDRLPIPLRDELDKLRHHLT